MARPCRAALYLRLAAPTEPPNGVSSLARDDRSRD